MRVNPPPHALTALQMLNRAGHEAWLVGGCVRDAVLGREPGDYDIATAATPEETRAAFAGYPALDTGLRHGTLTLIIQGHPVEVTTFRRDGTYSDGRHPDRVTFTGSLEEDLRRRDFTVNAMAWHPEGGLRDPMNGRQDCEDGLIRAVGRPGKRFEEDALRILRALRFSCQLGFKIEEDTLGAMMDKAPGLSRVSAERVAAELNLALTGGFAARALRDYPRVLFLALPELEPMLHAPQRTPFHSHDVWEHTLLTLEGTPPDTALRWAALFHDSGKPHAVTYDPDGTTHFRGHQGISERLAAGALGRLKQSRLLREQVLLLVRYHDDRVGPDNLRLWLSRLGPDTGKKLLLLQRADIAAHAPETARRAPRVQALYEQAVRLLDEGACLNVRDLAVTGHDLKALGYPEGKSLGLALDRLLRLVLTGRLDNRREALLEAAAELLPAIRS